MQQAMRMPSQDRERHDGEAVFEVQVQVVGRALVHRWTGWASNSEQAARLGMVEARSFYRDYQLVIRSTVERYRPQPAANLQRVSQR